MFHRIEGPECRLPAAGKFTINRRELVNNLFLKVYVLFNNLKDREEAQDLVEYALLITLVALAAVTGINSVASAINTVFTNISNTLA